MQMIPIVSYKRYNNFADLYTSIEIPKIQRDKIETQVNSIKDYIIKCIDEYKREPVLGSIDLCSINSNPKMFVIDGQHRLFAIEALFKMNIIIPIHCMIYQVHSYEEMEEIFRIRNAGIPVPDYLLKDAKNNIDIKRDLLREIMKVLEGDIFKTFRYTNTNRPYVNIHNFIDALLKSRIYTIINSVKDFMDCMRLINVECQVHILSLDVKGKRRLGISDNMLKVWNQTGEYFGYDLNFPYLSPEYNIDKFIASLSMKN